MKKGNWKSQSGQALVSLLFFMIIAIAITTTAIVVTVTNAQGASLTERSVASYAIAEAGAENAVLQLIRNPNYTGETLSLDSGTVVVQVSGVSPITIISEGRLGGILRRVQVQVTNTNTVMSVNSWKEIL